MLLGPVFRAELIRTPRRRRYYVLRSLYGLALLALIWLSYLDLMMVANRRGGLVRINDVTSFALSTFLAFSTTQAVALLFLIPALFGGVIADEKQRKTIHYLMASRLSGAEIVLDKFLGRMLHVAVFVLVGMPVMSLLGLFGGVPWEYVATAYMGTAAVTFFAATLATLVSTFARRVRQGVLVSYMLLLFWLLLPLTAGMLVKFLYPRLYEWVGPVNEWLLASNPVYVLWIQARLRGPMIGRVAGSPSALYDQLVLMVSLQVAAGVLFLLIAVVQLRPTFRRQESTTGRLTWFKPGARRPRWLQKPECGADAMLWKERHFARTDVFTKLCVLPATVILTVFVVLLSSLDESVPRSFQELLQGGYHAGSPSRQQLNATLRAVSPLYIGLWLLAVAGASASSLTVERDEDTWTSLVSTPLNGWEIIRGKIVGAVWGLRGFGGLLSLFWLVGLLLGAVHPLGLALTLAVVGLLTWAVAALGIHNSLGARSTSRALTTTLVTLIVLNGGYLLVLEPMRYILEDHVNWEQRYFGCTPHLASFALLSYDQVALLGGWTPQPTPLRDPGFLKALALGVFVLSAYVLAGIGLTRRAVTGFDVIVGRPAREPRPAGYREEAGRKPPVMVNAAQ